MFREKFIPFAFWAALPVLILILAFWMDAGLLAICLYALCFVFLVSALMMSFWLRPLTCVREMSADVVNIGDSVKVVVKLKNPTRWPILWLYAEETLPEKMPSDGTTKRLLFLPPRRSFHLHYRITITRRGCHQIGPLVLESGDVFGLFRKCRIDRRRDFVTALPPYRVIEEFQVGQRRHLGDLTAKRSVFEDPTRVRGVREYERGDALKRVHWKHSARTGRLYSKIYDPVTEAGATVVLDFHEANWPAVAEGEGKKPPSENAIEIACSICRYLSDGGWKVGFFSNGRDPLGIPGITLAQARATDSLSEAVEAARRRRRDERLEPISIRARRSTEQFSIIHENLGRIELSDGLPIEDVLQGELPYIEREQVLVVLTGRITDSFIAAMLTARELGYRIMVFVVSNRDGHDRAFESFVPNGIEVYDMDTDWRLKEIAAGRKSI